MRFSFIIPVYNVEKYLKKCLESLLNQTYRDFEIIVVDDGSMDGSGRIADEYAGKHPDRIKVIHQDNTGQGGARNRAVKEASGDYILMVDSDDYVAPDMLSTIENYLRKYNDDILIFGYYTVSQKGRQAVHTNDLHKEYEKLPAAKFIGWQPMPWNKAYRTSLFRSGGIRYPEKILYEDLATTPCLALFAENIGVIDKPLYFYLQRNESTMHCADIEKLLDICSAFELIINSYKEHGAFEKYYTELEWLAIQHILYFSVRRMLLIKYYLPSIRKLESYMEKNFPEYRRNPYLMEERTDIDKRMMNMILKRRYLRVLMEYLGIYRLKRFVKRYLICCRASRKESGE